MWDVMRDANIELSPAKAGKPRGSHPDKRLNAVGIRNLKEPGRYADGNGLYLFVDDSGAKRWILRTVVGGKRRDIGLGSLKLISLADAREETVKLRRLARAGGDPLAARRRERRTMLTFKKAAETVHANHAETFRNAKHKAQWLASLETYVFPALGARTIDSIDSGDIMRVLTPLWTSKPETARRLKQRLRVVLDWAKASGYRSGDNPVDGIVQALPRVKQTAKHHAALAYSQLPAFLKALQASDAGDTTKLAFEFLVLTASRTSEVLGARWQEIDSDGKTWTIPAARIKAGREHRVPLSPRTIEILDTVAKMKDGGPYVFPGRATGKPLSNMVFLMVLRRLDREDITAHGFRSAFRDWAAERTTFSRAVCEAALAHVLPDKTEAAYFRSDLFELRRSLMDTWAAFVGSTPAEVVTLRA